MSMLLAGGLPKEYEGILLKTDFRNMLQVDILWHETEYDAQVKTAMALEQLYGEIPKDIVKAIEGLNWFYVCGKLQTEEQTGASAQRQINRPFSFSQDAALIYAAFYATYNINLTTISYLHWWEFMALFEALPDETTIRRVMYWRTADLNAVGKTERKHIIKMRGVYALKGPKREPMTVEELEQQTKDRVARRFAEAAAALEG